MTLAFVAGDLFDSKVQTLVNPVNTVGVMGKGLALAFKERYPDLYRQFQYECEGGEFVVGKLWLYKADDRWILNFPTKQHWRSKSRLEYVESGLKTFVRSYAELGIRSIAFPKLGCGLGSLDWETQVKPLMAAYLTDLPIQIEVYVG
jgi:O-acetyl-ADP-ribose deacetylase (regulator of RNase III)